MEKKPKLRVFNPKWVKILCTSALLATSCGIYEDTSNHHHVAKAANVSTYDAQFGCNVDDSGSETSSEDSDKKDDKDKSSKGTKTDAGEIPHPDEVKKIAKFMHDKYGLSTEAIAGILGNWWQESMINPLTVNGQIDDSTKTVKTAKEASKDSSKAIGLGQWLGVRRESLMKLADKENDGKWWESEIQLKYMFTGDTGNVVYLKEYADQADDDEVENAVLFHKLWERAGESDATVRAQRGKYAKGMKTFLEENDLGGKADKSKMKEIKEGGKASGKSEGASSASTENDTETESACDDGTEAKKGGKDEGSIGESVKPNGKSGKKIGGNWEYDEIPKKYKKYIKLPDFDEKFLDKPGNNFKTTGNIGECTELTWAYMNQLWKGTQPADDGSITNGERVHEVYKKEGAKTTNSPTVGYGFSSKPPYAQASIQGVGHTGVVAGVMPDGKFIVANYNVPPKPAPSRTVYYTLVDGVPKDAGEDLIFFSGVSKKPNFKTDKK
ncbi:phage tail tip lysozyme [Staphylococcus aureus]|uniref:phage tail tip lysozyme n=1 Tax=Staphylococcus aureus TaxID=1280 RepID=UPI001BFDA251|nr:phage tail tip lysozyme [Staphylococcus aureus]MBZ5280833.1 hypothetical protein [Staphylococcus aureus]